MCFKQSLWLPVWRSYGEKSKIILHEENCNEKDLEYFISELLLSARPASGVCPSLTGVWQPNSGPGAVLLSGRVWIHPRFIPSPVGSQSQPQRGAGPRGAQLCTHTEHTFHPQSLCQAGMMKAERKRLKDSAPATQQVTGRAGKSSPTVTPVSPGGTRPGSPAPLLGKGRVSSAQLISAEKWGDWVKLGACRR